jgi:hypothetical protein
VGSALSMLGVPTGEDAYDAALEGLTEVNQVLLSKKDFPRVYDSGVRYEARPYHKWIDVADMVGQGWADCEGLAAWRAAELRQTGEDPDAHLVTYRTGPHKFHAVVMRGDGGIEDPSARLGMRIPNRANYYRKIRNNFGDVPVGDDLHDPWGDWKKMDTKSEPVNGAFMVVGEDPSMSESITFDVYKHGDGYSGVLRLPLNSGNAIFAHTSKAKTPKEAKKKGIALTAELAKAAPAAKKAGKKSRFGKFGKITSLGTGIAKKAGVTALNAYIPGAGTALSKLSDLTPSASSALSALSGDDGQAMLLGALQDE